MNEFLLNKVKNDQILKIAVLAFSYFEELVFHWSAIWYGKGNIATNIELESKLEMLFSLAIVPSLSYPIHYWVF